jgi:hypothetical protein
MHSGRSVVIIVFLCDENFLLFEEFSLILSVVHPQKTCTNKETITNFSHRQIYFSKKLLQINLRSLLYCMYFQSILISF